MWLVLCASCRFLTRASELFCGDPFAFPRDVFCLRRADVAFFRGQSRLGATQWPTADRVESRFLGSKGDRLRGGAVVTRVRVGQPRRVGAGGGSVDLMIELLPCCLFLPPSAALVAFWYWSCLLYTSPSPRD